jgi:hypothetical protein
MQSGPAQSVCIYPQFHLLTIPRVLTPAFFTAPGVIWFNFTGFVDADSGPLSYHWGVGSAPGLTDVLSDRAFNGVCAEGECRDQGGGGGLLN